MENIAPSFVSPLGVDRGLGEPLRDVVGDLVARRAELDVAGAVIEHDRAAEHVLVVAEARVDVESGTDAPPARA